MNEKLTKKQCLKFAESEGLSGKSGAIRLKVKDSDVVSYEYEERDW